jgi:type II secretory pathway pseudopilin PulG
MERIEMVVHSKHSKIYPLAHGFAYVAMLFLVATIALAATSVLIYGAIAERRQAEAELLRIGGEFITALRSYRKSGDGRGPQRLEELVLDNRFATPKRHLRKLYIDPLTGNPEWGTELSLSGEVTGVFSLSRSKPIKLAEFPLVYSAFVNAESYSEWLFRVE